MRVCVYRRYLAPGWPGAFADNDCLTQGRPGERKQDVHLTCHFPAGRLSERGRGWPPASGNRSLQPGMSARFQQSAQSRFGSVVCLLVGPRWRKDRSTLTNRNKKSSTEISVPVVQRSRIVLPELHGTFGYRRVSPNKLFLWRDGPEPNPTSCGHLCLMTPKKETLTNPPTPPSVSQRGRNQAAAAGAKKKKA